MTDRISVIVATIGRPQSLERLLASLVRQTASVHEVVIADGSGVSDTARVAADPRWLSFAWSALPLKIDP